MCAIKKTKTKRYSITAGVLVREELYNALAETVTNLNEKGSPLSTYEKMYNGILIHLLSKKNFHLHINDKKQILADYHEVVAIMWMLRNYDHSYPMLQLKSSIHQILS